MNLKSNQYLNKLNIDNNQEFNSDSDLDILFKIFLKNKRLLISSAILIFTFCSIYINSKKQIWEGQFQIVLTKQKDSNINLQNILSSGQLDVLSSLRSRGNASTKNLDTEITILGSQSVLKPVFDYVQNFKKQKGEDISKNRYKNWFKSNISIELERRTTVLNLSYRDKYKELIIPVINKISKQYQIYSGRDRKKVLKNTIEYLKNQINVYKQNSLNSNKNLQQFAIENDLPEKDFSNSNNSNIEKITFLEESNNFSKTKKNDLFNNLESQRLNAKNEIRSINFQIKQIEKINNIFEDNIEKPTSFYNALLIPEIINSEAYKILQNVDNELLLSKSVYTDKSIKVINLKRKRNNLIRQIKSKAYNILLSNKYFAEAKLSAVSRPKEVLIKYKELTREFKRDEQILRNLENQLREIELENLKSNEPWELITEPTLLDNPVKPKYKRSYAFAFLFSIFTSSIFVLLLEKKKNLFYSNKDLISLIPSPLLISLLTNSQKNWREEFKLLNKRLIKNEIKDLSLIKVGNIEEVSEEIIKDCISNVLNTIETIFTDNLAEINYLSTILILDKRFLTQDDLKLFLKRFSLTSTQCIGFIVIEN